MKKLITLAIFIILLALGGLGGVKVLQIRTLMAAGKAYSPPPETVSICTANQEKWPSTLTSIGSVTAVQGVTITPEIAGTVREIAFESGAVVAKGDLLVRLNTSSEEAQLKAIEAQTELAQINTRRARSLRADNTVSQSELDTAEAILKQDQANAESIRATLDKKTLRAPFAGRLGIRQINVGEYLDTGKAVVSLQALGSVHADFFLPQQELARLAAGMRVHLTTDAFPGRKFDGVLTTINPGLDPTTRNVGLQATFENAEQLLRPGMFARLEVQLPEEQTVLVIPATAVLSAPFGDSVYVVEASTNSASGLAARQQFIRTGRTQGDFVTVQSGLKPGEKVISSGVFKLRNGMPVTEATNLSPNPASAPRPSDS